MYAYMYWLVWMPIIAIDSQRANAMSSITAPFDFKSRCLSLNFQMGAMSVSVSRQNSSSDEELPTSHLPP
eukprot:gene23570-30561_t